MNETILPGLNGANPLGFMAAVGLLRVVAATAPSVRLGFLNNGTFHAFLADAPVTLAQIVADDAAAAENPPWMLEYEKVEKNRTFLARDLKAPPEVFRTFLAACTERWCGGDDEAAAYAAAFGTSSAFDESKGNTKPTAFHFTAAQMQFLGIVDDIRASVTADWAERSLFRGYAAEPGSNLRWDPSAERSWALMASDPGSTKTAVDAPLEWLAFRALPLFPTFPVQSYRGVRIGTTSIHGRGKELRMTWPLWEPPASVATVRSVLQLDWSRISDRAARGVFAVCGSDIRRSSQGYGSFGPAAVSV